MKTHFLVHDVLSAPCRIENQYMGKIETMPVFNAHVGMGQNNSIL